MFKNIAKVAIEQILEYARDEEKMEPVWDWISEKADDTDTSWDDVAVASVKSIWPYAVDMAEEYADSWLQS